LSAEPDEPCSHRCGYYGPGGDLIEHELNEHRPCTDCGAGADQDLSVYPVTHKPDCPRLGPQ
jgi:hypothetical protein